MKLLTYETYGGLIPDAVMKKHTSLGKDSNLMHGQALIAFVEGFSGNTVTDEETIRKNPDKLFYVKTCEMDGIVSRTFYGWHTNSPSGYGMVSKVVVNEYDETVTHVICETYDGSESLALMPKYEPVPGVPGLYRPVSK